jgi:hypothetical protein
LVRISFANPPLLIGNKQYSILFSANRNYTTPVSFYSIATTDNNYYNDGLFVCNSSIGTAPDYYLYYSPQTDLSLNLSMTYCINTFTKLYTDCIDGYKKIYYYSNCNNYTDIPDDNSTNIGCLNPQDTYINNIGEGINLIGYILLLAIFILLGMFIHYGFWGLASAVFGFLAINKLMTGDFTKDYIYIIFFALLFFIFAILSLVMIIISNDKQKKKGFYDDFY